MLTEICAELRNYFVTKIHGGTFEIVGGKIVPSDFLQDGQYFRITGSLFNDGVYQFPASDLTDEVFTGAVWAMAVPPAVIALAAEIEAFQHSDAGKPSPYISESFGGYSYTRATGSNGGVASWQTVFAKRLNKWRKI